MQIFGFLVGYLEFFEMGDRKHNEMCWSKIKVPTHTSTHSFQPITTRASALKIADLEMGGHFCGSLPPADIDFWMEDTGT